jgi:hypothetical protein
MPAGEIVSLLESRVANCGRHVPRNEIVEAVKNSLERAWQPGGQSQSIHPAPKWPGVNQEQRNAIIQSGGGLYDLWEVSPVRFDDNAAHTEEIIDALFPGDPLLCCGLSKLEFNTRPRGKWRGQLSRLAAIVPNPMTAPTGLTKDGKQSEHSLEATGRRWFLVIEFDQGLADGHAALLLHLAEAAPLALAVHSGGKSLHGWFATQDQTETQLRRFMERAVSLGADSAMWTRSQFARMPDGLREDGERQVVYYFDPEALQ